jgi:16S rRNA (guanine1207-N2)-methyltransferase
LNKIENAEVIFSDLYQHIKGKFDTIISNPPNTAGKELCFKLIDQSIEHLNQSGTLQIVARPNKGGKELAKRMKKVFGNVEELGRKSEYHVYKSVKA